MVRSTCQRSDAKRAAFHRIADRWDGPQASASYKKFCELNGVDIDAMHWKYAITWEMLEELRDDPLVEIGGHTVTHARISSLSPDGARFELKGSRDRLVERLGIPARHFAFPYGRSGDCGPRDFAIARDAGYASAATTRARASCATARMPTTCHAARSTARIAVSQLWSSICLA